MLSNDMTGAAGSAAEIDVHHVESEFQHGAQQIHVLVPDNYRDSRDALRVLYALPVEKSGRYRNGHPLDVLREMGAHNRHELLIVFMTMEEEPWFVDHPVERKIRQASYMHEFVVPFIDENYRTVSEPESRFLIGFSKGGWGAYSLIFTRPDIYGFAAAWDAPFLAEDFIFEMETVIGNAAQLTAYRPDLVALTSGRRFRDRRRLVLAGENMFGKRVPPAVGDSHVAEMHRVLRENGIKHSYLEKIASPHRFDRVWMQPVLSALMDIV